MKYLIGDNKNGVINFREMFYYWTICLMITYTLRAIIGLITHNEIISII